MLFILQLTAVSYPLSPQSVNIYHCVISSLYICSLFLLEEICHNNSCTRNTCAEPGFQRVAGCRTYTKCCVQIKSFGIFSKTILYKKITLQVPVKLLILGKLFFIYLNDPLIILLKLSLECFRMLPSDYLWKIQANSVFKHQNNCLICMLLLNTVYNILWWTLLMCIVAVKYMLKTL